MPSCRSALGGTAGRSSADATPRREPAGGPTGQPRRREQRASGVVPQGTPAKV